jgi:hypothetical protein
MNEDHTVDVRWDSPDLLLSQLRATIAAADPVPENVLAAARGSLTWLNVDAELAALVEDSALNPLAGVRGEGPRLLTFEAPDLTVVVEVTVIGRMRRLLGQLISSSAAVVELRHPGGSQPIEADDLGRFSVDELPAGPVSFSCRFADRVSPVVTTWVTV